ncbi:hypothetical protein [Nannocystis sp. SCPEA4]|nr:hypothetical protein [Nannocystis sp. SCPEA4]MCY1062184.1 hypothetical protein [Nannocystis sp. SCPEA4]
MLTSRSRRRFGHDDQRLDDVDCVGLDRLDDLDGWRTYDLARD